MTRISIKKRLGLRANLFRCPMFPNMQRGKGSLSSPAYTKQNWSFITLSLSETSLVPSVYQNRRLFRNSRRPSSWGEEYRRLARLDGPMRKNVDAGENDRAEYSRKKSLHFETFDESAEHEEKSTVDDEGKDAECEQIDR